ncbi:MAG: thioesterase family protein [Pirellulales bacterium]|nr:thioesterase family protein [Pirellulales bacterium]
MPDVFEYPLTVGDGEIDEIGRANNVAYVAWMQAAALAHSAAQGWPAERYRQMGIGWVVRSHRINYLQPALAGDELLVETWVAALKKATSLRRYRILRRRNRQLLAKAETDWAFVDYATGKPMRIPVEIARSFQVVER